MRLSRWLLAWASIALAATALAASHRGIDGWTVDEKAHIAELAITGLPSVPPDPSNRVADDERAAELGQRLFFDPRFSGNGKVSCASCHDPGKAFQDGTPLAHGVGVTARRTMSIVGTAHSPWLFWDGRKDSQWAQALGPLESAVEHGGDRAQYAHLISEHYLAEFEAVFGKMPSMKHVPAHAGPVQDARAGAQWQQMPAPQRDDVSRVFADMGKAIAAYERWLEPAPSRFDAYAAALERGDAQAMSAALNPVEVAGLKLFIGKANCIQCHSGPLFSNHEFHNTGVPGAKGLPADSGRADGVRQLIKDEFNCLGRYSDAKPGQCGEIRFLEADARQEGQFRVPSLRNVGARAPYMHAGQFATLDDVVAHYNSAPKAPVGHGELKPLKLDADERAQLVAFLRSLDSGVKAR